MKKETIPNHFKIRHFTEDDLEQVMEINLTCLPENYPDYFFRQIYYKYPKSFLVAEHTSENSLIGYCMFREEKGISNFGLKWTKKGHLVSIAVREQFRKQKIATHLLKAGLQSMKEDYGVKEAILEVRISNAPAIEMYKQFNFKIVKTLSGYYKDGEDAYLMSLKL
ncbi:MAG: GNAT family N-acetyltransferase [Candidatus Helarchaeota archaeon]